MKFLLISHGKLAEGLANSCTLFLGDNHPFYPISAFVDDCDVDAEIDKFMKTVDDKEGLIVCTDIMGGSVNQKMMTYVDRPNTAIFSGMNLPMILQLSTLASCETIDDQMCRELLSEMQGSIVYMKAVIENQTICEIDE